MPKLSVAMTTYNGERFVLRQLESLRDQTRRPDEVVIVDDGSTDRTAAIVRDFIEENGLFGWRFSVNDGNLGFVRNFQKAMSGTTGDIVFLCDQDDEWHKEKLALLAARFAENEGMLAVSTSFDVIDGEGNRRADVVRGDRHYGLLARPLRAEMTAITLPQVMHSNISPGCTAAYRRSVVDGYLAHSAGELPHDYELNLFAAAQGGLYFYDRPLVNYRLHGGNTLGFSERVQTRAEIAAEKLAAAKAVRALPGGERLCRFSAERLRALTAGGVAAALRLWRYREYYRFYSLRERLGDIAYTARARRSEKGRPKE